MIEIIETWGQFIYWFPKCAASGMIVIAALLAWIVALQFRPRVYTADAKPRTSWHVWSSYGIYTPNGWLTAPENISNSPGLLSVKLRKMWNNDPQCHDWVVAEIPPDAGPPAQEAIVLQRCTKPPGLGECGEVCGTDYRG